MYRRRLASSNPATVWFRPVNGPLEPLPWPLLKPLDEVQRITIAALLVRAPRPLLKPNTSAPPVTIVPAEYHSQNQTTPGLSTRRPRCVSRPSCRCPHRNQRPRHDAGSHGGIQACVFDAYGTLFDVHSAVARLRARVGEHAEALSQLWRVKQLEYTWLRALMGAHAGFWQVTADALDYALPAPASIRRYASR